MYSGSVQRHISHDVQGWNVQQGADAAQDPVRPLGLPVLSGKKSDEGEGEGVAG